jgi:NTP pyrophosphatase (non-canonical NTP hydrolase)
MIWEDINRYTNEWIIQNVGDPARFELTPSQFGRMLVREAGEVIDEEEMRQINEELNWYSNEWVRRNVGDPAKFELTPEQYLRWLMREAGEVINESELLSIEQELEDYTEEWSRRQSEQKTSQYLTLPGSKRPRRFPQAQNAQQPIHLSGYYGAMP